MSFVANYHNNYYNNDCDTHNLIIIIITIKDPKQCSIKLIMIMCVIYSYLCTITGFSLVPSLFIARGKRVWWNAYSILVPYVRDVFWHGHNECHYKRWRNHCLILLFAQSVWKAPTVAYGASGILGQWSPSAMLVSLPDLYPKGRR